MPRNPTNIEKISSCCVLCSFGIAMGTSMGGVYGAQTSPLSFSDFVEFAVVGALGGLFVWLLLLVSLSNRRRRFERKRQYRMRLGVRSPWGEQRKLSARPYQERLAHFVASNEDDQTPVPGAHPFSSQMALWTSFDLPRETTDPKPPWFIRRILERIQTSVRG